MCAVYVPYHHLYIMWIAFAMACLVLPMKPSIICLGAPRAFCFFQSQFFCFIDSIMYSGMWCETMRINANLLRMCIHKRNLSIYCAWVILLLAKKIFNWNYFAFKESTFSFLSTSSVLIAYSLLLAYENVKEILRTDLIFKLYFAFEAVKWLLKFHK